MTRLLAQKKSKKQKRGTVSHLAKKAAPKVAPKTPARDSASKGKLSSAKTRKKEAKKSEARKTQKKTLRPNRPVPRESSKMEVESGKHASRTVNASPVNVPARLLHQTKTTSPALALLGKGVELIFQKEFKKAKNELKSLLQTYPGELDILARARSYMQICEREEANLKKPAASADQLYALGILEHNKSNYDAAISYFLQSLAKHPKADYIYYSIAASHAKKGDTAKSIENLRKAVALNEDSRIYAKNDADFAALQSERDFAELVGINSPLPAELK
jgi:tetratricopeptide (TPR) repeat protein